MTIGHLYEIYLRHPSIRTDTRQLQPGDLFFALKGPNFNGNAFAAHALGLGAAYAIIDEDPRSLLPTAGAPASDHPPASDPLASDSPSSDPLASGLADRLIVVADVLTTLQELALHHRRQFSIPFIAITGSNGKTTTKELIHAALSSTYITYTTQGNLNNHIGIPLTLLSVRPDAQLAVIEMGANHQKEIEAYCAYTLPTHGIITNVGKAHLEGFGGPEGVKKGKGELYDYLRAHDGTAFVLSDSADLTQMSRGIPHLITYGSQNANFSGVIEHPAAPAADPADPAGAAAATSDTFLRVNITHGADTGPIQTQLVGDYNLPNVLVAVAVAKHFGVPDDKIRQSIEAYTPSNSRSQLIEKDGLHIILDAYNANPSSMRAAIENFARIPVNTAAPAAQGTPTPGLDHKVLILGAMAELGPESLAEHQAIIDLIAQYPWQQVVLVGGDFRKLSHPYLSFANAKEAGHWLAGVELKDAWLLIKGSRSMKMEEVLGCRLSS